MAMTSPVVARLREKFPNLRLTIETTLPRTPLATRYREPFTLVEHSRDFGMIMATANDVLVEESAAAYAGLHTRWQEVIREDAERLAALRPDLVLANIPYAILAAAKRVGIPSVALSCLNWAGVYRRYCGDRPEAAAILRDMHEAYASAQVFLQATPAMPMPELPNGRSIGPVAPIGRNQREAIFQRLELDRRTKLCLVGFGGMNSGASMADWPAISGWHWISGEPVRRPREDMVAATDLSIPFSDILQSCDAIITKPGYGTFVEAACGGIPVLFAGRDDWPEEPALGQWMSRHTRAIRMEMERLRRGDVAQALDVLLALPVPVPTQPTGVEEAAGIIAEMLLGCG
ncbi:MAG: hypothetical protein ABT940_05805 [Alphaproteobacteria bacterium]